MLIVKLATGGRNRFIDLSFFQVQPSAFMMIALVLGLARYLRFRQDQRRVSGLVVPFLLTLVPMALVGSVTIWAMIGNLIQYFGDFERLWLLALSGGLILVFDVWILIEGARLMLGPPRAAGPVVESPPGR